MKRKIALLADLSSFSNEILRLETAEHVRTQFLRCPRLEDAVHAREIKDGQKLDLAILFLDRFVDMKAQPLAKIKGFFRETPLLVYTRSLDYESRLDIVKIPGVFAMDSLEESPDLIQYVAANRYLGKRGRGFLRTERARELQLVCSDEPSQNKIFGHFVDYSQTGAQVRLEGTVPVKSRVCLQYVSKSTDGQDDKKIRKIESYVVWSNPLARSVGLQFLAVV